MTPQEIMLRLNEIEQRCVPDPRFIPEHILMINDAIWMIQTIKDLLKDRAG